MLNDRIPTTLKPSEVESDSTNVASRAVWRAVAVPNEHGGWGLTIEPVLLGLLLAFSWSGVAVGAAAFLAFLVRTPLKLALGDRRRKRSLGRTALAGRIAFVELVLIVSFASAAILAAGWAWLLPVVVAVPLVAVELWYDVRSRSRRLLPELCGTVGITSVAAAIVLAGHGATELAVAAWLILAGRGLASVPFVRTQIFRLRRGQTALGATDAFQVVGAVVALGAVAIEPSVVAGAISVVVLALAQMVWLRRPVAPPKVTGIRQMIFGFAVVGITALSAAILA